jgi:L-xylulose reductase
VDIRDETQIQVIEMEINFSGKRVLVTGAGRGIGNQVVRRLLSAGATVIAVSKTQRNLDQLKDEYPTLVTICIDIGNWKETKEAITKHAGAIDLLVNNAAYAKLTPVIGAEVTEQECDDHFDVNVKGIINITQIVAKGMIERKKGGSIVNVSSQAGLAALKDHLVYCASKAAVDALTKVFALEYGPFNIRVNSVNPTVTMTDMAKVGWSEKAKADAMIAKIPLGRFAEVSEVVDTIIYLLSDKSSMINGTLIPIDGGFLAC